MKRLALAAYFAVAAAGCGGEGPVVGQEPMEEGVLPVSAVRGSWDRDRKDERKCDSDGRHVRDKAAFACDGHRDDLKVKVAVHGRDLLLFVAADDLRAGEAIVVGVDVDLDDEVDAFLFGQADHRGVVRLAQAFHTCAEHLGHVRATSNICELKRDHRDHDKDHWGDHGKDHGRDHGKDHGRDHGRDHERDHGKDHGRDHGRDHDDWDDWDDDDDW